MLYHCEKWYLTLKERCRLRVYENRILRRIFEPKSGEWRRLRNELHSLYRSPNIVRVIKSRSWAGHVATIQEGRSDFKMLTGKRPRRRWEDSVRKDLKEIGINTRNWVDWNQVKDYWRALVNATLNLRFT